MKHVQSTIASLYYRGRTTITSSSSSYEFSSNPMWKTEFKQYRKVEARGRTIVVGDIHGCLEEFQQLLKKLDFSNRDLCICCGDFIDRGPASFKTAQFIAASDNILSVLGNHERKVALHIREGGAVRWSQLHALKELQHSEKKWLADFLVTLPAIIETPDVIVAHARLDPALPVDAQSVKHVAGVGGKAVVIEKDQQDVPLWFHRLRDTNSKKALCIGHLRYKQVELVKGLLYALDTAAVSGGRLSAVCFPGAEITQCEVGKDYHKISLAEWNAQSVNTQEVLRVTFGDLIPLLEGSFESSKELCRRFYQQLSNDECEQKMQTIERKVVHEFGEKPESGDARCDKGLLSEAKSCV